ncbi:MAG TPA: type II toxin-antitoxin system RelE/ParE family toxin [Chloroflexota bacterium]|nr:type II toxin-antitoxin system RelE/ParE family toxin [Chloroflexota bacterium]
MSSKRYRLVIARRFAKDLSRCDPQVQERVLQALERLEQDPYRGEKVLARETGTWRLRVGDWRVRYDIVGDEVHVLRVRHRREVYRQD